MADNQAESVEAARCVKVLVLDDDELLCKFLERSLTHRGFEVASETAPADALERLAAEDFDVVVSDLNMEGLDGLAFTERAIVLRPDSPVILITGAATMEVAVEAVRRGAWDFLSKPIDARLLALSIDRACAHRQLKQDLRALRSQIDGADFTQAAQVARTSRGSC